jgi:hypothetical protein
LKFKESYIYNSGIAVLTLAGIIFFTSCKEIIPSAQKHSDAVARVGDEYLSKAELKQIVPPKATKEDSLIIVKNYVDDWVKQRVYLKKAEQNLGDDKKNVERQLQDYRNDLIKFIYEKELVRQKLDTAVSIGEIEQYYYEHKNTFSLKDNIVKAWYVKTNKKTPKTDKARVWIKSNTNKDFQELEAWCHAYASDFSLNDQSWISFDDILKKVPIKTYDKEEFLKNNRNIETTDSVNIYLISIKDFQIKEDVSPLSFVKDDIKALIINKRKLALIQEMQKNAMEQALKNKEYEIY